MIQAEQSHMPSWMPADDPKSYNQFARTLTIPDGTYKGEQFDPGIEPAQQIICDVFDGKITMPGGARYNDLVIAWAVQTGKSLISILVPALHTVVESSESVVYCLPTKDLIDKVWTTKLKPSIEGSGYGHWLPEKGPGSRGGRPASLPLVNPETGLVAGYIIFIAGGSGQKREAGQAGVTVPVVVIDEADEYENLHAVQRTRLRSAFYGSDALTIATSTVKKDLNSIILALHKDSTESHIEFSCPKCKRYQAMDWEQVSYEGDNDLDVEESARYECKHCQKKLTEELRKIMLSKYLLVHGGQQVTKKGKVTGDRPRSKTFGLRCSKLDFGLGSGIREMALEHYKAKKMIDQTGDHSLMRSFYRDKLTQEYTLDRDEIPKAITNKYLASKSRRSTWAKRSVPAWAEHLFLAIDVQHDRVYWCVIAMTSGMRWAPLDWAYEYGDAIPKETSTKKLMHQQLDIVREIGEAGWTIAGTEDIMYPSFSCVDIGYRSDEVGEWIKRQGGGWIAVRGYGEGDDEKGTKPGKKTGDLHGWGEVRYQEKRRENWLFCESRTVIRWMHGSLLRESGHDGSGEIPLDSSGEGIKSNDAFLLHLTQNVYDFDVEKGVWYWRKVHSGRRDYRDTVKYGLVLGRFFLNQAERQKQKPRRKRGIRKVGTIHGG